jgi:hypothetical protein
MNSPQIEHRIEFEKLDEWIEHPNTRRLEISCIHPIFLEIKKIFEVILRMDRKVMDGWKYKNTFLHAEDIEKARIEFEAKKKIKYLNQKTQIDSFVTCFIMILYH